jgi:hypothetical protein
MHPRFAQVFGELRRTRFAELAGSRAAIDLAVPEALINQALAQALAGSDGRLRGVTIAVAPDYKFHLDLKLSVGFLPSIAVEAVLDRQAELPHSPELVFRWRTMLPGLAGLAGSAASFFKKLPPGVRMEGDRVFVHVGQLFARAGAADLLPLLSEARLSTREHVVDLHILMHVNTQAPTP